MVINIVMDLIIYNYKGTKKFVNYLDFIFNLILSMILIIPIKNTLEYSTILFTLVFTNNIIFIRSRLSNKFFIKSIQYLMMLLYSILTMFVSIFIYLLIK